ncbi:MAG: HD domain-containing protein [Deltaproteobacteria bacterium]|nr:HD domain-containing protein [Deltaproteobacteria bacterium]
MKKDRRHKKKEIRVRLRTKFMLSIIVLEIMLMTAVIFVVEHQMQISMLDEFTKRGLSLAKNLAAINTNYLATYNYVNIEQSVERVVSENGLAYAIVLLFDGEVAAYSGPMKMKSSIIRSEMNENAINSNKALTQFGKMVGPGIDICDISVPILLKGEKWGTVRIGLSLKDMHTAMMKTRLSLFALGALAVIVSCLFCLELGRRITKPIGNLVKSVEAISNGEYEQQIKITTKDEIAYLGIRFEEMQKALKNQISMLTDTNEELTKSNRRLHSLFHVSQAMNSIQNQQKLYDRILEAALTASGDTLGGNLIVFDQEENPQVVARTWKGRREQELGSPAKHILESETYEQYHWFVANPGMKPLLARVENFQRDTTIFSMKIDCDPGFEFLSIPLQQSDTLLGYINLIKTNEDGKIDNSTLQTLSVLASHATASIKNNRLFNELEEAYLNSIKSLAKTQEFKDEYTYGHAERVAKICMKIGKEMCMDEKSLKVLYNAALLHDIGKIGVVEKILNKNSDLDPEEWNQIRQHPVSGEEILRPLLSLSEECRIVRHHHEREDGRGYPDGLYGSRLSLSEKIIIVADAFDAMNSKRAYRPPLSLGEIKEELEANKGTQFDEEVVDVFLGTLESEYEYMVKGNVAKEGKVVPFQFFSSNDNSLENARS